MTQRLSQSVTIRYECWLWTPSPDGWVTWQNRVDNESKLPETTCLLNKTIGTSKSDYMIYFIKCRLKAICTYIHHTINSVIIKFNNIWWTFERLGITNFCFLAKIGEGQWKALWRSRIELRKWLFLEKNVPFSRNWNRN